MRSGVLAGLSSQPEGFAPIVQLSGAEPDGVADAGILARARGFAEPLLRGHPLESGEDALMHADAVADILQAMGASAALRAAVYLTYAADYLSKPEEAIGRAFGQTYGTLVGHTRKLVQILRSAREATVEDEQRIVQAERVRKMLLAFSRDLRVVRPEFGCRLRFDKAQQVLDGYDALPGVPVSIVALIGRLCACLRTVAVAENLVGLKPRPEDPQIRPRKNGLAYRGDHQCEAGAFVHGSVS